MALKRLPIDVQSLLCASAQVNNYKTAIEELIYNSLDAESTSIAIRIHIQENTIQVIDNGCGITKHDLNVIGQRYMTSKLTDLATLKDAPKSYGHRGEFLANILIVSQMVKITSRHESTEETWAKTFFHGKEKKFAQMTTRPTKGTTVNIKGFLYNLNIQRRGIDPINDLQNIKLFLEQLSLVHNNISLSLRDDSQNEIVFKIHKKRDVYQTLSTLFDINNTDVLELQVEKNKYKVKGLIGKTDKELDLHWIYLNGKFIYGSSKLHKIINDNFRKYLGIKDHRRLKSKKVNDELQLFNKNIPLYFIFVTCPYIDYDIISNTTKQSAVEFKNWEQINKLLEKLVKFYIGDDNLKEIVNSDTKLVNEEHKNIKINQDTRDQVKKIMDKILGNNSKNLRVSQLQNGVKGKLVKRKIEKKKKRCANVPKLFVITDNKPSSDVKSPPINKAEYISEHNIEDNLQKTDDNVDKIKNSKKNNKNLNPKKHKPKEIPIHKKRKQLKTKMLTSLKNLKTHQPVNKQKHAINKQKKIKSHNTEFKKIKNTDSVCKKSKIVARKAEEFLQHDKKVRESWINYLNNASRMNKKSIANNYCALNYAPPPKANKYIIEKYIMNKIRAKSYKTTYDLIQTVMKSQQEILNTAESNSSDGLYKKFQRQNDTIHFEPKVNRDHKWSNKLIHSECSNIYDRNDIPVKYKTYELKNNFSEYLSVYDQKEISNAMDNISEKLGIINKKKYSHIHDTTYCTQKEMSHYSTSGPLRVLTYDSHQCHKNADFLINDNINPYTVNKRQNIRFITKQSTDNFVTTNDLRHKPKKPSNKRTNFWDIRLRQTIDESFYTIEYSKTSENHNSDKSANGQDYIKNNDHLSLQSNVNYENLLSFNDSHPFGNTYTIHDPLNSPRSMNTSQNQINIEQYIQAKDMFETYSIHDSCYEVNYDNNRNKTNADNFEDNNVNLNIVFVSKSQNSGPERPSDSITVQPLNMCETVFNEIGSGENEFAFSFNNNSRLNDSLYDNYDNNGVIEHFEKETVEKTDFNDELVENVSHHFTCAEKTSQPHVIDKNCNNNFQIPEILEENLNFSIQHTESLVNAGNQDCNFEINQFNLKDRPRFMPKGMSQIFENCRTRTVCDYNLNEDYYEDSIYNNFANDVQVNSVIYEPIIQNVEDLTTKNIQKFQTKVKKDNASLVFDETSLKEAKVLGQVDCKFIAAIMNKRCEAKDATEYLILFDQHAVHERIRLETNLTAYIKEDIWTTVPIDKIILKLSKDEAVYLHNYKDKFTQLGLQWTILSDNEVIVHSIPEAILGKNPREVEKVIKAVTNLITEEINFIKLQKGCMSLYPKSIMDLVFSEACRYAIKFGDQLSKNDCIDLLNALSNCKTPFQCAHGRPVMAVIMDIKTDKQEYKINKEKLNRFRKQ